MLTCRPTMTTSTDAVSLPGGICHCPLLLPPFENLDRNGRAMAALQAAASFPSGASSWKLLVWLPLLIGIALVSLVPAWRMSLSTLREVAPSEPASACFALYHLGCFGRYNLADVFPPRSFFLGGCFATHFGLGGCLAAVVLLVVVLCSGRMLRRPSCDL